MKSKQLEKNISKETVIAEILAQHPEKASKLSQKMMEFGIHCVGCGASTFETLEQGVLGHGYSEEELEVLVNELNIIVKDKSEAATTFKAFSLTLTDSALKKVAEIMKQQKKSDAILRISVLAGGCSGRTYDMEIIDKPIKSDLHFKQKSIKIAVDKNSLDYLNGSIVDFVDTLNESGFKFNNPNAHRSCGCGKSFK